MDSCELVFISFLVFFSFSSTANDIQKFSWFFFEESNFSFPFFLFLSFFCFCFCDYCCFGISNILNCGADHPKNFCTFDLNAIEVRANRNNEEHSVKSVPGRFLCVNERIIKKSIGVKGSFATAFPSN